MDSKVLTLAKELVVIDTKELDDIIASCEKPALISLARYSSSEKMSAYLNYFNTTFDSVEAGSSTLFSKFNLNDSFGIKVGSIISIPVDELNPKLYSGVFVVESVVDNSIELRTPFVGTETGTIVNNDTDNMLYAHAYLILSFLSLHSQSIVKGDVIYSSQQFGQGTVAPASMSEKKMLADRYQNQALRLIGTFKGCVI